MHEVLGWGWVGGLGLRGLGIGGLIGVQVDLGVLVPPGAHVVERVRNSHVLPAMVGLAPGANGEFVRPARALTPCRSGPDRTVESGRRSGASRSPRDWRPFVHHSQN